MLNTSLKELQSSRTIVDSSLGDNSENKIPTFNMVTITVEKTMTEPKLKTKDAQR